MSSKYIVQRGVKEDQYFVIHLVNNKAVKKLGPYPKGTANTVARTYTAQDEARRKQLEAHSNLEKGDSLTQSEAIEMMQKLRDEINRNNKKT